jgi:hypothetical protein
MSTFLAGLSSRRWLNLGVLTLGVLALLVAVATPLYARSSAEHLLDQRTLQRPATETGLNVETAADVESRPGVFVPVAGRADEAPADDAPEPLTDEDRQRMLDSVTDLMSTEAAGSYWRPATTYLLTRGTYMAGAVPHPINTYWRDGMCDLAHVEGRCPSAPDEALIDPVMLRTIGKQVGDRVTVLFSAVGRDASGGESVEEYPQDFTVVGTYTIDDNADPDWFDPGRTGGDASLRPPSGTATTAPPAPALLVDGSGITFAPATVAGADRPIDTDKVDISTMDAAESALAQWQTEIANAPPPVLQPDDLVALDGVFDDVRAEHTLLSRVTLAAVVPLIVLALLLLYVLISSAAEVRRQEVALAKLRGFSTPQVVRFALAEPVAVLLLAVPFGMALAVVASRVVTRVWLGETPFVITPQAVASAVVVTASALLAAFVAVLGVVREPLATSLASATRRRTVSRWALLAQGALVMLSVAAVVQIVTSDATQSSSFVELLAPLFVALGAAVLAMVAVGVVARGWMARTTDRGGLSPFLASRRLVRRQDLVQLVLPLLLATSMAAFAACAWKVADDWRVSKASAVVGADRAYFTDTNPARLLWVTRQADPDGRYLTAVVPPAPRTEGGARVALVDTRSFGAVAHWDGSWGASAAQVQDDLTPADQGSPITFTGSQLTVRVTDVRVRGGLNLPLEVWLRYVTSDTGEQRTAKIGTLPKKGSVSLDGFVSECDNGCTVEQLSITGSSSSVTDAHGDLTIADVSSDGTSVDWRLDDSAAWRPARPFDTDGLSPLQLEGTPDGLHLTLAPDSGSVFRLTTTDLPEAPPMVSTTGTALEDAGSGTVAGASLLGTRTPMTPAGTTESLPIVGNDGGLSDLRTALREYGDQSSSVSLTELLVAGGTPTAVLDKVRGAGVDLSEVRTYDDELDELRSDAFSLGWKVFLLVGVLTLLLAFLGVLALAIVQLRWRSYEVAALRVVGVRRRDLRRAIVAEYVALLGMAVVGGALAAVTSLLLVLPSLDIGTVETFDPAVDYSVRWLVMLAVVCVILLVVLGIALWIARRTVKLGTPATLRQADAR